MSTIADVIAERRIEEVVHFTTNRGVLGMFAKGAIMPRRTLPKEKYLEHVYKPNAEVRKDPAWTGHVSLSISRVNTEFFGVSRYWHSDTETWWAIVSLDPDILCHKDVVFVTTNNIYPARRRGKGDEGLRALFADPVLGYYGHPTYRTADMPDSWTTDVQAEALYPGEISTDHVRRIHVLTDEHADLVASQYDILRRRGDASDPRPVSPLTSDQISSPDDRRQRILASAQWAAYGDALGFIGELTDRSGLRRRANVDRVSTTVPWSRRIGGQFGPTVKLPAGAISDDTQLRLATSRSIRPSGDFDVETFSEIEMTTWPAYALGAGRGSLAAAASLRRRDTTWATNFFDARNTSYLKGGGNGAAMRVQPHVWASPASAASYSWLADVIVNSICTHGHERGFVGAAFHAACVSSALTERRVPGPEDWLSIIGELRRLPAVIHEDDRLAEIWLGQWEKRSQRSLETAVEAALTELAEDTGALSSASPDQRRAAYVNAVEALKAFEPSRRGSGTKTSLLAALVAWVFAERPEQGLVVSADYLGTDTDTIATMAGAILGAAGATPDELPGVIQDHEYIAREADRMWAAAAGLRPPRFPYPDVLAWRPPRSGTDAVAADDDQLHLVGLGPGGAVEESYVTEGKTPGVWQWMRLWFGQTILAKRREHPPKLASSHRVELSSTYVQADLTVRREQPTEAARTNPNGSRAPRREGARADGEPRYDERRGRHAQPPLRPGQRRAERSLDEITDEVIKAGLTDAAIGAGLREVASHERAIESGQAFSAIIVKALVTRERQRRRQG